MDRNHFLRTSAALVAAALAPGSAAGDDPCPGQLEHAERDGRFVAAWLTDLFEAVAAEVDPATQLKLLEACGRGCYRRHPFKKAIADRAAGDVDRLIEAYRESFEAWREGAAVHVRYGAVSKRCYCPAARGRDPRPGDLHCECTRATHQAIFEAALGRPVRVEILESLRRGGRTCHFLAHPG
jgi:hypothetical protein